LIVTNFPRYKIDSELFGYSPDDYIKMGKPGPDDVEEELNQEEKMPDKSDAKKEDSDVVNPDNVPLNVIRTDEKENGIDTDIEANEIKEVKTILTDDEKLLTGESDSDQT